MAGPPLPQVVANLERANLVSETPANSRNAAQLLVAELVAHGVDRVFCVPGESYLAVLDALYDERRIEVVTCRHESGAGFMAVADAKLTGRPGIAMVSRGPGATNAAIAVHTAQQDAAPFILFVGQIERRDRGRRAFQEVNYGTTFGDMAKYVVEVHDPARLSDAVAQAFHLATTGTRGPAVVVLPEDFLLDPAPFAVQGPKAGFTAPPAPESIAGTAKLLASAERPLLVVGTRFAQPAARAILKRAAEAWGLPVAVSFRHQDLFDNVHPLFAGHLGYMLPKSTVDIYQESDLVLAVGTRLGDVTTQGYVFPTAPKPRQRLVHVYDDPAVLGSVFNTDLAVLADPVAFLAAFAAQAPAEPLRLGRWAERLHRIYADGARWEPHAAVRRRGVRRRHRCAGAPPWRRRRIRQRRRKFLRLARPLFPAARLPPPPRTDLRRHGLRRARRGGGGAPAQAPGDLAGGGRRLPDDRQ